MLPKAHLTTHSRIFGSMLVITPSWWSGSWRSFLLRHNELKLCQKLESNESKLTVCFWLDHLAHSAIHMTQPRVQSSPAFNYSTNEMNKEGNRYFHKHFYVHSVPEMINTWLPKWDCVVRTAKKIDVRYSWEQILVSFTAHSVNICSCLLPSIDCKLLYQHMCMSSSQISLQYLQEWHVQATL